MPVSRSKRSALSSMRLRPSSLNTLSVPRRRWLGSGQVHRTGSRCLTGEGSDIAVLHRPIYQAFDEPRAEPLAAAIALYFISDWIVNLIERRRGERLEHRSLLFFAIIFVLATLSFNVIDHLTGGQSSVEGEKAGDTEPPAESQSAQ